MRRRGEKGGRRRKWQKRVRERERECFSDSEDFAKKETILKMAKVL